MFTTQPFFKKNQFSFDQDLYSSFKKAIDVFRCGCHPLCVPIVVFMYILHTISFYFFFLKCFRENGQLTPRKINSLNAKNMSGSKSVTVAVRERESESKADKRKMSSISSLVTLHWVLCVRYILVSTGCPI